jgi:hypothetical protein
MKTLLNTALFCILSFSSAIAAEYRISADFDRIAGISDGDHVVGIIPLSPGETRAVIEGKRSEVSTSVEKVLSGTLGRDFAVKCGDTVRADKPVVVIKHPGDLRNTFLPVLQKTDRQVVWSEGGYLLIAALEDGTKVHIVGSGDEERTDVLQGGAGTFYRTNQEAVTIVADKPIRVYSGNIDERFVESSYLLLPHSDAYVPLRAIIPLQSPADDMSAPENGGLSRLLLNKVMPWIGAAVDFLIGGSPAYAASTSETLVDNGDGTFSFTQRVDRYSSAPHYTRPWYGIGFGYYNWYNEDWGLQHSFPYVEQDDLQILSSALTIRAWDVDAEPWRGYGGEYDGIQGDGNWLNPQYLQGTNGTWSVTNFDVDPGSLYDGSLDVWIDIDMHHTSRHWATKLDYSLLSIQFTYIDNDPPFTPQVMVAPTGCTFSGDDLSVSVAGPKPADPDGDSVTYRYRWLVDPGTGNFIDDEFAGRGNNTTAILPSGATRNNDRWRVEVTPVDEHSARGTKAVVTFATIGQCNTPPIADAGQDRSTCPGAIELSGKDSYDPDGAIGAYSWEIYREGGWETVGTASEVSYDIQDVGTYQLRLTVTDNYGATDDATVFITVEEGDCGFADVRLIDTIPADNVEFVQESATLAPYSVTRDIDRSVVEWKFGSFGNDRSESISFDLNLYDLVPGENRLVDHGLELIYKDRSGAEIGYALPPLYVNVLESAFNGTVVTDKPAYGANENALVTATVKSLSGYSRTLDVKIQMEDSAGSSMSEKDYPEVIFEPGITREFTIDYATGSSFAGDYRARLLFYEGGKRIGEAATPFEITPDINVTSAISSDKAYYGANEPVLLTSEIVSKGTNYVLRDLTARITLEDEGGRRIFEDVKLLSSLPPLQSTQLKTTWNTGDASGGRYTVQLKVSDTSGLLATSSAEFEIVGTAATGSGVKGVIDAQPTPVRQGDEENVTYSVTNQGNEEVVDLPVTVLIVNAATLEVKQVIPSAVTLPVSITAEETHVISTDGLAPGEYLALLRISPPNAQPKTLARASFKVVVDLEPKLEITKKISGRGNVLVWLNYPWRSGQHCPDRVPIERALRESGMLYRIVTEKDDFQAELRNPLYTDFVILGGRQPIEDHFSEELREQVHNGKGLVVSMFSRRNLNEDLFGVNLSGSLPGEDFALELLSSAISDGADFVTAGKGLRAEAHDPEENVGWLVEEQRNGTERHPAAIVRRYGKGKVVFLAFDLGFMSSNYDPFATLLTACLDHVHSPVGELLPGQPIPVEVTVKTLAGSVDLKFVENFSPQVALFDGNTGQELSNPWSTDLALIHNEERSILYNAFLPREKGTFTLTSDISYADGGIWKPYGSYPLDLVVEHNIYDLLDGILFELDLLNPTQGSDRISIEEAKNILAGIPNYEDGNLSVVEVRQIIHELLKAVNELITVQSVDVEGVRYNIDSLLLIFEAKWYALQ